MTYPGPYGADEHERQVERAEAHMLRDVGAIAFERLVEQQLTRTVAIPKPAAGVDLSFTVPAGSVWIMKALFTAFTTSAVVSNRSPRLRLADADGNLLWQMPTVTVQAAAITWNYIVTDAVTGIFSAAASTQELAAPTVPLLPGYTLSMVTPGLDVGDQWAAPMVTVQDWSVARVAQRLAYLRTSLDSCGGIF